MLNPALDDPEGPRGMGPYALFQPNRQGTGIRPRPYSRNMEIQPFTYDRSRRTAGSNGTSARALPHGLGHGWAAVLWDMAWNLVDKHGFNPNVYEDWNTGGNNRALQYVWTGSRCRGAGPASSSPGRRSSRPPTRSGGEDVCTLWAGFSRRGLGFSAVQGTTDRNDNTEAFDTNPACREGFTAGADEPYGSLNSERAGDVVTLKFRAPPQYDRDNILAGPIFSRKVDCSTFRWSPRSSRNITPREFPIPTKRAGADEAHTSSGGGQFRYRWQSDVAWKDTCREFVLTREDGKQHRAFFSFR